VSLLELHVDVGKGLAAALAQRNQAVVGHHQPQADKHEKRKNDPAGVAHDATSRVGRRKPALPAIGTPSPMRPTAFRTAQVKCI